MTYSEPVQGLKRKLSIESTSSDDEAGPSTLLSTKAPKLASRKLNWRPNSTHVLLCDPADKLTDCIARALGVQGIASAVEGTEHTQLVVTTEKKRFCKLTTTFD